MTTAGDITMVIGLRAHAGNPWVLSRLRRLRGCYDPAPRIHVVDFGSPEPLRDEIAEICAASGFTRTRSDDTGTYSAACARNVAAGAVETDLVFFCDIDCFSEADLFRRLAGLADALDLRERFDQMVNLPVYHLGEAATRRLEALGPGEFDAALERVLVDAPYSPPGTTCEFVAPYSNIFLCHRRFFELAGGYDETFRGHGSEDFEFLLRFACVSGAFPLPASPLKDVFGPRSSSFQRAHKPYRGFRRLFELMALQAQLNGLRVAHLHHPTGQADDWIRGNDWRRSRFVRAAGAYLGDRSALLAADWIGRARGAVLAHHGLPGAGEVALALRVTGRRPRLCDLGREREVDEAVRAIEAGEVDVLCVQEAPAQPNASVDALRGAALRSGCLVGDLAREETGRWAFAWPQLGAPDGGASLTSHLGAFRRHAGTWYPTAWTPPSRGVAPRVAPGSYAANLLALGIGEAASPWARLRRKVRKVFGLPPG